MATLQNAQIDQSFGALLKTDDNGNITATAKAITDGAGNATNMEMSNTETKFSSGTVDFTGATVIGVGGGGAAGLESGTGTSSMQSASSLTTNAADASGQNAISLGDATTAPNLGDVNIGDANTIASKASTPGDVVIGQNNQSSTVNGGRNVLIGNSNEITQNEQNTVVGYDNTVSRGSASVFGLSNTVTSQYDQTVIGSGNSGSGSSAIAIGKGNTASGNQSMAYGEEAQATATSAAAFGQYAEATATYSIAFGRTAAASGDGAVAFGQQTSAAQAGAVAMGRQVTADTADTTHVRALKIVAPDGAALGGNGITMLSPDGTASEVTVTNSQELAINGTAIGGGGGLTYFGTGKVVNTSYIANDIVQSVFTIPANTFSAGDYFMIRSFETRDSLNATQYSSLWITPDAQTVGNAPSNPSGVAYSFSQIQQSGDGTYTMKRHCFVSAANETNWMEQSSGSNDDAEGSFGGAPVDANNVDWTVDQYVYLQMWSDSTTGTYTNYGMHLTKLN